MNNGETLPALNFEERAAGYFRIQGRKRKGTEEEREGREGKLREGRERNGTASLMSLQKTLSAAHVLITRL